MNSELIFKAGPAKRILGLLVFLAAAVALVAMIYGIITHPEAQTSAELWSGVAIGVFLLGLMVAGIAIQYVSWSTQGDTISYRRLFKSKTIRVSELAGFGQIIVVTGVIPSVHADLYDHDLKPMARLPVSLKDWPKAEAWLAARLRYVVNDGSPILPKYRFADTPRA
jgi:hypothetical protein